MAKAAPAYDDSWRAVRLPAALVRRARQLRCPRLSSASRFIVPPWLPVWLPPGNRNINPLVGGMHLADPLPRKQRVTAKCEITLRPAGTR
jgi:hypothetical protein